MSTLEKATLQELSAGSDAKPIGDPVEVQFNPTSLKLKLSNQNEGGRSRGRQTRQHVGASSTTLSMDLIFDTADEGETDNPLPVHRKTAIVEKYVLPKADGKETPPKVRFHWGNLIVDGVVESLDIDFDHFAPNGVPLRAKMGLSIKAQDPKYEFLQVGPGAKAETGARDPNDPGAADPGSEPEVPDRSQPALEGETPPEFMARMGLDPLAWRGLAVDLSEGLALQGGVEVGFNSALSATVGIGVKLGFEAEANLSLEASFGLSASVAVKGEFEQGTALSAAGGVVAAVESVGIARATAAANASREQFPVPSAGGGAAAVASSSRTQGVVSRPESPSQERTPLSQTGIPSANRQAASAPALPQADRRAITYGFGIPLRETVGGHVDAPIVVSRTRAAHTTGADPQVPMTRDPTRPPWEELPLDDRARQQSDEAGAKRKRKSACHCCGSDGSGSSGTMEKHT